MPNSGWLSKWLLLTFNFIRSCYVLKTDKMVAILLRSSTADQSIWSSCGFAPVLFSFIVPFSEFSSYKAYNFG